jgi:hypothetical protein
MSHGQSPRPTGLLSRTAVSKDASFGHGVSSRREADSSGGGSCRIGALEAGRRRTHATMGRLTTRTAANHLDHRPPQAIKRASPKNIATPQRQKRREKNVGFSEGRDGEGWRRTFGLWARHFLRKAEGKGCHLRFGMLGQPFQNRSRFGVRQTRQPTQQTLPTRANRLALPSGHRPTACNASVVPMRMSA